MKIRRPSWRVSFVVFLHYFLLYSSLYVYEYVVNVLVDVLYVYYDVVNVYRYRLIIRYTLCVSVAYYAYVYKNGVM